MCRALRDNRVDILLATTDAGLNGTSRPTLETVTTYKGLPVIFFKKQWGNAFKYSRPFTKWLVENVSHYDLVHIHAVFNHACIAAARAARKKSVPYIVRPLGTLTPWALSQKSLRKKIFWHGGVKGMLLDASAIHYTSRPEQEVVEASLGLIKGFVIPLGAELPSSREESATVSFQQLFPLYNQPYVLVLSRLLQTKGIDVLLDAFLSLTPQREFSKWRLVLAGDGPADYVASLKKAVASKNATERVLFPGWLSGEKKASALQNAAILALPSYYESFGLCVIEALACRVPVLISPHVSLAPEIEAAGAGWVTPVSKISIEETLRKALSSKEELVRRGGAGQELAAGFQWRTITVKMIDLYDSLLYQGFD